MEFPELGTHCSSPICSRLDFLPIECDACHKIFCKDHSPYAQHNCEFSYTKDARVPVCPLCNQPVPINRGEDPNIKVNFHIQNECKSEKAKTNSNRCTVAGCKKKELVPVKCNTCQKNFCLKHRFETDHNCQGPPQRLGGKNTRGQQTRSPASNQSKQEREIVRSGNPQKTTLSHIGAELNRERMMRLQNTAAPSTSTRPLQPDMGEDEALAHAIAASIVEGPTTTPSLHPPPPAHHHLSQTQSSSTAAATAIPRDEDEDLARAIAASLNDEEQPKPKPKTRTSSSKHHQGRNTENDFCTVS